jgi:PAS domain S-box-containing protein
MLANHNPANEAAGKSLEAWVPKILTTLRAAWTDYVSGLPGNQSAPSFRAWLSLLHAAATTPALLPKLLAELIILPDGHTTAVSVTLLIDAFELMRQAATIESDKLTSVDWQNIIEIENRILRAATGFTPTQKAHPDTGTLSRRALYLQIVAELGNKIKADLDQNELLHHAAALIQQDLDYDYVNIFILNPERQELTLRFATWKSQQPSAENFLSIDLGQGIVGLVAAKGQPILVKDVSQHPDYIPHPALMSVKSQLAVPLRAPTALLGVLDVESDRPEAFSRDDQNILSVLGNFLGVALENLRLRKAHKRFTKEQTFIYDALVSLGTSSNVEKVLRAMSEKITLAMGTGACTICRLDHSANTVTALAEYVAQKPNNPDRTWRTLQTPSPIDSDPIAGQLLKVARPTISRAPSGEAHSDKSPVWHTSATQTADSTASWNVVLSIPIEIDKQISGMIEIYDEDPTRTFSVEDIQFGRILAHQTAMALEQARLFDETVNRLNEVSMLYTMAQKIAASLDLDEVLNTIVVSLREVIGCRACCIFLLDEDDGQLQIRAASGLKPQWRQMAKLQLGEGAAGRAAAENRTVYIPDASKDADFVRFDDQVKSLMVVPLLAHGRVIGAVNVDDDVTNAFGPAQERLLTIAATQAGISIENARLFTEISTEQKQMQAVIQHMADGILLIDHKGSIVTCNSTLAGMLDLDSKQIIGQNVDVPNLAPNLARVTESNTQQKLRTGVLTQEVTTEGSNPRTLQIFTTSLIDDNKQPAGEVRVVHDITREKELEHLKDEFFSTISHELRTPLFSIQGFAQILQEDPPIDRETQKDFLQTIQRQAIQLGDLVNNLLDISKLDEGKMVLDRQPVSLVEIIHQTVLKLQGYAHQQQVKIVPELSVPIPNLIGDKQRLEQVLTNLIGNAIKFSPAGEIVTVAASLDSEDIIVAVKDNGVGIPAEALKDIFSRYYQASPRAEESTTGTGLGLHIAKQIIASHGGRIWAESEVGRGSTFYFSLPRSGQTKKEPQ